MTRLSGSPRWRTRLMSPVFLYGDVRENFNTVSKPFVRASGGQRARIALLMLPRSEKYATRYREAWLKAGAGEVAPIYPPTNLTLTRDQLRTLKQSTGVFMSGGRTSLYQRAYGSKGVSSLLRELHDSGVPYGGVSAGAKMACDYCTVGGTVVKTRTNEFPLASKEYVTSYQRQRPSERPGLVIRRGLGLVKNCVLQPHFTEFGLLPGLMEAMSLTGSRYGIGVDEPICLELRGETRATVRGRGRLYFFSRPGKRAEGSTFRLRVYEPGSHFELRG